MTMHFRLLLLIRLVVGALLSGHAQLIECLRYQCGVQKMWLGGQTESFQNVGGAKVYTMY